MKDIYKRLHIVDYVFVAIILLKITLFYLITDITKGSVVIGIITIATIGVAFYSFLYDKKTSSWKKFVIVYCFISFIMFFDSMYYSYFNQLLSINQIFQAEKLLSIKKSIKHVSVPLSSLLIIDVPYVIWYYKKLREKFIMEEEQYIKAKRIKRIAVTCLFTAITIIVVNPLNADTVKAINHNEVITYHLYDFYTNIFGEKDNVIETSEDVLKVLEENRDLYTGERAFNGIGKDKNLIVIQVESLGNFAINRSYNEQELTPNLNKLINDQTIYFENYYQTIGKGNTSDAEFSTLNSLYPNIQGSCYEIYTDNTFYGLPWIMQENGYSTTAFHGYVGDFWNREEAYKYQGFQDFKSAEDFNINTHIGFGMADEEMFTQTIDYMKDLKKPFFSFIVTLSCHHPYEMPPEYTNIEVLEEDQDTVFGNYMQAVHYSDQSLGLFLEMLKENDLYEDSIIVLYGDHHALNYRIDEIRERMTSYLGYPYQYDEMLNVPLMIHVPGLEKSEVKTITGGQVDFLPTIANVMGTKINNPYIVGRDLLNSNNGFTASVTYLFRGSFISNGVLFEYSDDAIYEESRAWRIDNLEEVSIEGYEDENARARNLIDASKFILDNNLIVRP